MIEVKNLVKEKTCSKDDLTGQINRFLEKQESLQQ